MQSEAELFEIEDLTTGVSQNTMMLNQIHELTRQNATLHHRGDMYRSFLENHVYASRLKGRLKKNVEP